MNNNNNKAKIIKIISFFIIIIFIGRKNDNEISVVILEKVINFLL